MNTSFPSAEAVRVMLEPLTMRQLERLAELSGVPMPTIYKIARDTTKNPGIDTCRAFVPHIAAALASDPAPETAKVAERVGG